MALFTTWEKQQVTGWFVLLLLLLIVAFLPYIGARALLRNAGVSDGLVELGGWSAMVVFWGAVAALSARLVARRRHRRR